MAQRHPVVLIHGYSDRGASFLPWRDVLLRSGYAERDIHICSYRSLTNEVTIKDIAEGFDRALRKRHGLEDGRPFDAIVHSTGMLVIRSWLSTYQGRRGRLKRIVALAPATHGSPLAHKGRGFLGAVFKGNRESGPDFLEAGDLVLDGLELGGRFTWDLTHRDLLCDRPFYGRDPDSPYVFILCGTEGYGGIRQLAREEGSDGTVRWAGCSLDTRKITLNLARDPAMSAAAKAHRADSRDIEAMGALPMPFWPVAGKNHGTIVSEPDGPLVDLVLGALSVDGPGEFEAWQDAARAATKGAMDRLERWQQFVVRVVDERGDPVPDYHIELFTKDADGDRRAVDFDVDVHLYRADPSLRCFHVSHDRLLEGWKGEVPKLWVRLIASSGSELVGYHGVDSKRIRADGTGMDPEGVWDAELPLPETFGEHGVKLFHPFTTTFVEVTVNRDPMPFATDPNRVCVFGLDWTG
jgi:pimeloyl-ACP methyl ester carboxylesterase